MALTSDNTPAIRLKLVSGLRIENAARKLIAKFALWPWANYDGVSVEDADRLMPSDVDVVYRLGSRSPRAAYESLVAEHGNEIAKFLCDLPKSEAIEQVQLPKIRGAIVGLYNLLTVMPKIKLAGATKLVARHRPSLLPVLDSVLDNYYWYAVSIADPDRFDLLRKRPTWGDYIYDFLCFLQEDVRGCATELSRIREAIKNEPFSGVSNLRIIESLIWYTYAVTE